VGERLPWRMSWSISASHISPSARTVDSLMMLPSCATTGPVAMLSWAARNCARLGSTFVEDTEEVGGPRRVRFVVGVPAQGCDRYVDVALVNAKLVTPLRYRSSAGVWPGRDRGGEIG